MAMQRRMSMRGAAVVLAVALTLSGCSASYRTHGWVPAEEDIQQIVPGIDTRASVEDIVGVPSTAGTRAALRCA